MEDACARGRIPGGVLALATTGGARRVRATGFAELTPDRIRMHPGMWFDLASLTKVIFTTERILSHAVAGQID
ncbi:MAG: esterase, partial [Rhodobacteraceae bacterium]|nr:esterase [Paracoccaceae bacterium]